GIHRQGVARRETGLRAPQSDGHLPEQLPAAVRARITVLRLLLRPAGHRPLLPDVRPADGTLADGVSRAHPRSPLRVGGRGPGRECAAAGRLLRPAVGRRVPALRTQCRAGHHRERRAGARADLPVRTGPMEAVPGATRTAPATFRGCRTGRRCLTRNVAETVARWPRSRLAWPCSAVYTA